MMFSLIRLCKHLCFDIPMIPRSIKLGSYLKILCKRLYFSEIDGSKDYNIVIKTTCIKY